MLRQPMPMAVCLLMKSFDSRRTSVRSPRVRSAIAKTLQVLEARSLQRQKANAAEIKKTATATRALRALFQQLIAENAAANHALREVSKHRINGLESLPRKAPVLDHVTTSMLSLQMHEDLAIVGPPYDFEWQWGNPNQAFHNKSTGRIAVEGKSGAMPNGQDGRVAAASGIGLAIITDRRASVSVRPFIDHSWQTAVGAVGLGAYGDATVGIDAAAFVDGKMHASGVHRDEVFSDSRATPSRQSGGAVAWVPSLTLNFELNPGQVGVVNFGAYVECDHNSGLLGSAAGGGRIDGQVKWLVVERFLRP
jgi:hypothetical protein